MITPKEYSVPKNAEIIFVSDLFASDYSGGAELTTEAYIAASPANVFKMHSTSLTPDLVKANKDKIWILGNWTAAPIEAIAQLVVSGCTYYIIEYDYKICKYRSPQLHKNNESIECNCKFLKASIPAGLFVDNLYSKAEKVFFMSEEQANYYVNNTIAFGKQSKDKRVVTGSAWLNTDIQNLVGLREVRLTTGISKPDTYAVLTGGTWIKNQAGAEQYCNNNNIPYELIGKLPYHDFLETMAQYKGLVFHPAGFDTAPRLVIEARLLGLELHLNDFVQHKNESWFLGDFADQLAHIQSRPSFFWSNIKLK